MDSGLLPDPGMMAQAGNSNGDGSLPVESGTPSPIFNPVLTAYSPPTATSMDPSQLGADPTTSALSDPANLSGNAADAAQITANTGYDWSNLLGGLIQTSAPVLLNDYATIPAKTAQATAVQGQAIQGQIDLASLGVLPSNVSSNSLFTILIWGAIAFGIISLLGKE